MYAITGASGNIGHVIVARLLANGKKVRAIGRSAERLQRRAPRGAENHICDLKDSAALAEAFRGTEGVYLMIPPDMTSKDYRAYQDEIVESIAKAVEGARVERAVVLSSVGADKEKGTGPVAGLHALEERLKEIDGLNLLLLRPGYFMENTIAQIGIIRAMGTAAGPLRADLKLQMIATRDIAAVAAEALAASDIEGHETRELLGQRDLNMAEAARIIGRGMNRPTLAYQQLPDSKIRAAMIGMGMSQNLTDLLLEMSEAMNSGHMAAIENRSPENTTPTAYETFVEEEFMPRFRAMSTAA